MFLPLPYIVLLSHTMYDKKYKYLLFKDALNKLHKFYNASLKISSIFLNE